MTMMPTAGQIDGERRDHNSSFLAALDAAYGMELDNPYIGFIA
jgi:hypothetical protein